MTAPVCDLILLSWNQLPVIRPCLESLFRTTTVPSRLLLVDNGSEPEVRAFLRGIRPQGSIQEVVLLQNETNEGFPRGMNRGLRASTAPYACLLNNDLVFASGWLEELLAVAEAHPEIGVLNPTSSTFGNVPAAGVSLEAHAARLRERRGEFVEVGMCIGFCLLIRRAALDRVGLLSEDVDRMFFEDEDFCVRAQQAGYRCVVASGSYVYHAEHQSVRLVPEREALFQKNRRWCHARWGRWVRMAWPRFSPVQPGSEELRAWLTRLLAWARRRTRIHVYSALPPGASGEMLFRSVGLVPHADILWVPVPRRAAPYAALGRILVRKKPFDVLVAPVPSWGRLVSGFGWLHRARVVPEADEAELVEAWQRSSRFPSSS